MQVKDVMIPALGHVSPDDSLRDAAEKMKALNLSPMPVVRDGKVVGVLTEQTMLDHVRRDGLGIGSHQVQEAMSTEIVCCDENEPIDRALQKVEGGHTARLPVLDRERHLVGIVAIEDLRRGERLDAGGPAGSEAELAGGRVPFDEDRVDFMSDASFPASDPLPSPVTLGRADDCDDEKN
jgi:CBS domain-containing protein